MSELPRPIFARRLAEARKHAGLSQAQVGVLAGMEPEVASPRVNQYERGVHEPRAETAQKLADALGVPAAFLYTEDEMLAKLLLLWNSMSKVQRREVVKLAELSNGAEK
ncbi:helix-turn-helix domain-containing protein [Luteimonas fraxinea]|uniref:Helix-turn-helix domain-containing protein n=1 Tax=Luteimonas fraxinea TaxID=2901869 RepID=A0ABS8UDB5_9GAMM|nr:helix-turn-helix transcriptional regulator [Luteimonas fraxinea]MCD9096505.1 helix-turn-helix domain-containing protein [Luteimonas fraxinea]